MVKLYLYGDARGGLTDEVMKVQLRKTIEEHFLKERKFKDKGIKVLSLFFIDRVANYRSYGADGNPVKGKFALWFEEIYKEMSGKGSYTRACCHIRWKKSTMAIFRRIRKATGTTRKAIRWLMTIRLS